MNIRQLHHWTGVPKEAVRLQRELAARVNTTMRLETQPRLVAGADVAFDPQARQLFGGVVVYELGRDKVVERSGRRLPCRFPYVPGLLSFRELPALLEAFRALSTMPDVVICDGHGIAHPRRMGIASHLGLWLGVPTVGCAKKPLVGEFVPPADEAGAKSELKYRNELVGYVLRTRTGVKPVYISVGHLLSLQDAVAVALMSLRGYKLPEPVRLAHNFVTQMRKNKAAVAN